MPKNLVWFNSSLNNFSTSTSFKTFCLIGYSIKSNLSLQEQTKILDEHIWHTYHKNDKIEGWLDNFQGEDKVDVG
jgi:hypothetical protein